MFIYVVLKSEPYEQPKLIEAFTNEADAIDSVVVYTDRESQFSDAIYYSEEVYLHLEDEE